MKGLIAAMLKASSPPMSPSLTIGLSLRPVARALRENTVVVGHLALELAPKRHDIIYLHHMPTPLISDETP